MPAFMKSVHLVVFAILTTISSSCGPSAAEIENEAKAERFRHLENDKAHTRKCEAVFQRLKRELKPGMTSRQVSRSLTDKTWIEQSHSHSITILAGWIPVDIGPERAYSMALYPNEDNRSNYVIYFSLTIPDDYYITDTKRFTIEEFLTGKVHDDKIKLHQIALCYPYGFENFTPKIVMIPEKKL